MRRILLASLLLLTVLPGAARAQFDEEAVLDTIQFRAFRYFWEQANPANGLIKDRNTVGSPASIASMGFGLSGINIGVERGWVSREDARQRVLTTLNTLWTLPQGSGASGIIGYRGWFYHFLDMNTGHRTWSCELSSIDTALLLCGVLDVRQFFNGDDPTEIQIRARADSIYRRLDVDFMRSFQPALYMGWKPGTGFGGFGFWRGYNEAMVMYVLALGHHTQDAADSVMWTTGWTPTYTWRDNYYGQSYVSFAPLFGHQYSHCWVDFRGTADRYMRNRGIDYFENSRRATYAQRQYQVQNPLGWAEYSDSLWGLTAGDGPTGYRARGAPPAENDDGTISPTAPVSSLPFAPEIVWPVIRNLWNNWRLPQTWGPYGWVDAFNPTVFWNATDVIGIDQGPMLLMIENYRTGGVWARFMSCPEVQLGLERAGFRRTLVDAGNPLPGTAHVLLGGQPNPFRGTGSVRFRLAHADRVRLALFDVRGREVLEIADGHFGTGEHVVPLKAGTLPSGVYLIRMTSDSGRFERKVVLAR